MKKMLLNLLFVCMGSTTLFAVSMPAHAENVTITEENNHVMGNNLKKEEAYKRNQQVVLPYTPKALPRADFIDISSWSGEISVESYKKMNAQGVKGVVVKLTEFTTYRNPLAKIQIENAKKAGLTVSVFHYSWFVDEQKAVDEANYFADFAEELNLSPDTVMVNDAEEGEMIPADVTITSMAFKKQLNKRGFNNVIHYSMASWFTENYLEFDVLGKENSWVAEWPKAPSSDNLLHSDTAGWQWSSQVEFEGVPGVYDANVDYLGRFISTPEFKLGTDLKPIQYYQGEEVSYQGKKYWVIQTHKNYGDPCSVPGIADALFALKG
ncbi:hypothetical protein BCR23_07890 [Enterococcus quebecensis]|uniref:Lysozyme n=2 Tax=Enterococcus quebecensis TaxID=903983 RepID=A0A1E5GTR1_9ENTE|nr:hypothetical protein BCR23_07890 [Enterococcus quebecensis]